MALPMQHKLRFGDQLNASRKGSVNNQI